MPGTLADVMPAVAAAFGIDAGGAIALAPARDVIVLVIDGLGADLLSAHVADAPTLAAHVVDTLQAGFPATTATSLTSLAVGAPCATHGIIGYSFAVPEPAGDRTLNALRWRFDGAFGDDARTEAVPERIQPVPSRLEQLAAHDVDVHYVVPGYQVGSGLTRAAFRAPGTLHPASDLAELRAGILAVARHDDRRRRFAYAYHADLDMNGHLHGPGSPAWIAELRAVEALAADLFADLPPTATLLVTGDHGMIAAGVTVDLDAAADLHPGVRSIAGEARVRHVYAETAAAVDDVAAAWRAGLGDLARVVTREQAIDERWFGPRAPDPDVARRLGDVIAVAEGDTVLVRPAAEPMESTMIGHHGAWTRAEQLVPLIATGAAGT